MINNGTPSFLYMGAGTKQGNAVISVKINNTSHFKRSPEVIHYSVTFHLIPLCPTPLKIMLSLPSLSSQVGFFAKSYFLPFFKIFLCIFN